MSSRADWTDLLGRHKAKRQPRVREYLRKRAVDGQQAGREGDRPARFISVGGWLAAVGLAALLTGGVYATAWSINAGKLLPLVNISLAEAPTQLTREQLRGSLAGHLHPSLIGVDCSGIRDSLEELPWVGEVRVRRVWPGTVELHINERQALAVWNEQALVEDTGQVFQPAEETFAEQLPRLSGPPGSSRSVANNFKEMRQLFEKRGISLKALRLSERGSWTAEIGNEVEVYLGREQPLQRVARFVAVVPELKERGGERMKRVDLRYPNGLAVAWTGGAESD